MSDDITETSQTVAAGQLRAFFERWQRLEEEKKTLSDDLKGLFAEAKGTGFDTKTMSVVFRDRVKDRAEIDEAARAGLPQEGSAAASSSLPQSIRVRRIRHQDLSPLPYRGGPNRGCGMIALGLNFCRHLAGSSFRPRVKFCQEPARSIFHRLEVSKVLSFAVSHAQTKAWSSEHDAQKNSASGAESYE